MRRIPRDWTLIKAPNLLAWKWDSWSGPELDLLNSLITACRAAPNKTSSVTRSLIKSRQCIMCISRLSNDGNRRTKTEGEKWTRMCLCLPGQETQTRQHRRDTTHTRAHT